MLNEKVMTMSNGKVMIVILTVGLIRKTSLYKMSYFPEQHTRSKNKIKFKLDFSNYTTKSDYTKFKVGLFGKKTHTCEGVAHIRVMDELEKQLFIKKKTVKVGK